MSTFIKYRNHQLIGNASTPVVFSASSDHTLTNPCPSYVQANFTVAGQNLVLPSMIAANSLSLGESIVIENIGYESFTIKKSDGITDVYVDFPPTARMQFYLSDVIAPEGNFVYTNAINAERVVLKYEAGTYQVDPTTDLGVTLFLYSPSGVLTLLTIGSYPDDFFFYVKSEVGHSGTVTPFVGQTIDSRSVLNVTGLEGYKIFKAYNSSNVPNWYIQAQMIPPGSAVEYNSLTLTIPLAPSSGGTGVDNTSNTLTVNANSTIDQDVSTNGSPTFANVNLTASGSLRSPTSASSILFQAYDVDNTTYRTFATLVSANTPSFNLVAPAGGELNIIDATTITASSIAARQKTTDVTGTTQAMAVNNAYSANNGSLVTLTLPVTAAVGDMVYVSGLGAGGWRIAQNASQLIHLGSSVTTTGVGGRLDSTNQYDSIALRCVVTDTTWVAAWAPQGNITVT